MVIYTKGYIKGYTLGLFGIYFVLKRWVLKGTHSERHSFASLYLNMVRI